MSIEQNEHTEMKLLILDLDETLIHARNSELDTPCPSFNFEEYTIYRRPYLEDFLAFCEKHFKVAIWTSSSEEYATKVVQEIFENNYPLEFVWSRERCVRKRNLIDDTVIWLKDLRKVKNKGFKLEHVIVVDDTPAKLGRNYGNHVYIKPFEGNAEDCELTFLMKYLLELKITKNIRSIEKRRWRYRF